MKKALAIFAAAIAILSSAGAETLSELESKAASGDANALFALGTYYAKGENGAEKNPQKAIGLLTKAAEANIPAAQAYLGYLYGEGKLVERNMDLAVYWRELAAANGKAEDKWVLGNAFLYGFFLPKNQVKALFWISQAAEEGDGRAILKLIEIYKNLKNEEQLKIWQAKFAQMEVEAAKKGNVAAMEAIAKKYMKGTEGLPRNRAQAIYWYKQAAEKGNIEAMEKISQMYAKGRFLPKNPEKAQFYFEKLAETDVRYCFKIANYYVEGNDGFPQDYELAEKWYERGAEKSDISTQAHLAWKYWAGSGVRQNTQKAAQWCEQIIKNIPDRPGKKMSQMEIFVIEMSKDISSGKAAPQDFGKYVSSITAKAGIQN